MVGKGDTNAGKSVEIGKKKNKKREPRGMENLKEY